MSIESHGRNPTKIFGLNSIGAAGRLALPFIHRNFRLPHPRMRSEPTARMPDSIAHSPARPAGRVGPGGGRTLIAAHNISVRFGRRTVLDQVSVRIHAGEIVTLVGLNGAGKSTLVRSILEISPPDSGRISRAGGLRIGYAPQHFNRDAILPMTVKRFLRLGGPAPRERLESAMEEVGAGSILDTAVSDISGGELNRVLLARALLRNPHLLVLDEPFSNVDATGQIELYGLVEQLRNRHGCGVLVVTHDLHFVLGWTDTLVCLDRHSYCAGVPEEIFGHPVFIAIFGRQLSEHFSRRARRTADGPSSAESTSDTAARGAIGLN